MGLFKIEVDDEDFGDLLPADEWEDTGFLKSVAEKYPGWFLVKLPGFTARTFVEVKEWLVDDNVRYGKYEPIGWSSNCAYSVGVVFENAKDAVMFKLRWR